MIWVVKIVCIPLLVSRNINLSQLISRLIIWLLYLREVSPAHLFFEPFDICVDRQIGSLAGINKPGVEVPPILIRLVFLLRIQPAVTEEALEAASDLIAG